MTALNVFKFRAALKDGGAKANLFRVIMNFPVWVNGPTEQASFLIKASSFPAAQVGKIELDFRGRKIPYPGDRTFEDWNVTVINGNDFAVRDALIKWQNGINDFRTNTGFQQPDEVLADMKVEQLDKNGNAIKTIFIRGAFPQNVGQIDLSFDNTDTIETFETTFAYIYWEPSRDGLGRITAGLRNALNLL